MKTLSAAAVTVTAQVKACTKVMGAGAQVWATWLKRRGARALARAACSDSAVACAALQRLRGGVRGWCSSRDEPMRTIRVAQVAFAASVAAARLSGLRIFCSSASHGSVCAVVTGAPPGAT